jgi:hypothetical protein
LTHLLGNSDEASPERKFPVRRKILTGKERSTEQNQNEKNRRSAYRFH